MVKEKANSSHVNLFHKIETLREESSKLQRRNFESYLIDIREKIEDPLSSDYIKPSTTREGHYCTWLNGTVLEPHGEKAYRVVEEHTLYTVIQEIDS